MDDERCDAEQYKLAPRETPAELTQPAAEGPVSSSPEFREMTKEELDELGHFLARTRAEEDAIDLLRKEALAPDRTQPLSFDEARELVRQKCTYPVPDDAIFTVLEEMPDEKS
jgi:hypothetical protein